MNKVKLTLFTAGMALATAFIFSCEQGPDSTVCNGEEYDSSKYECIDDQLVVIGSGGNPNITYEEFTDARDGKTYLTVEIGTQTWMAQNLNYKYHELGPTCYDGKESNCNKYGMLYEYYDAIRACPTGWHLPTRPEWDALLSQVGSNSGKKLKAISEDWRDGDGTDDHGFGALPGGFFNEEFSNINITGWWWTATENSSDRSVGVKMDSGNNVSYDNSRKTANLYSVRCVLGSSSSSITYGEIADERDGQKYRTVKIGTQNWMAENLNYEATNSPCYNYKENNCGIYGRLYDWDIATKSCPEGWKLPTRSEWEALVSYVDDNVGRKLKARSEDWRDDGYGIDFYGFGALPGGFFNEEFSNINITGWWWTATENSSDRSAGVKMDEGNNVSYDNSRKAANLYSVRCIEDL
jgi:uncharacterized protein (TIGR02145 family)